MTDINQLPPHTITINDHPEPHIMQWSDLELAAIKKYAERYALQARALRPVQVPMTDDERNDMICTVTTLCAKLSRQAIAGMAIDWTEAHHGITAQAKKETP